MRMKKHQLSQHNGMESPLAIQASGTFDEMMESDGVAYTDRSKRLTWRGDPSATLADFTIVVVTNELQSYTHHVHRSVLCFGGRNSGFFRRVVPKAIDKQNHRSNKNMLPSTKVELDQRDVRNFPVLLDFMYSTSNVGISSNGTIATANSTMSFTSSTDDMSNQSAAGEGLINAGNAVSLRHLARIFEVESLTLAVTRFIQKDLNVENALRYLVSANEYQDARLFQSANRLCLDNFTQLDKKDLTKLPYPTFRILVRSFESIKEDDKNTSFFLSEVVCRYLEKNRNIVTAAILLELTDNLLVPYIAPEAAIGFTAIIKSLKPEDAKTKWDPLVRLCRRCAETVVKEYGWSDFAVDGAMNEYLGHSVSLHSEVNCVDSLLFATSFAAALAQAQGDYGEVQSSQSALEGMLGMLSQTVDLLEKANERKDRYMSKQDETIAESRKRENYLENEVRELKQQLEVQKQLVSQAQQAAATATATAVSAVRSSSPSTRSHTSSGTSLSPSVRTAPPSSALYSNNSTTPPRSARSPRSPRVRQPGTPRHNNRTPKSNNKTSRPVKTMTQSTKHLETTVGLMNHAMNSEDPAIRDLVSPSSMLTQIRGRNTKTVTPHNLNTMDLELMRSTSLV